MLNNAGDFVSFADPGLGDPPLTRDTTASELLYGIRTKQVRCTFTAIVGFREYIFSAASGALGKFAAATEYTFGTITQRTLTHPGRIRLHYGHPDLFNKVGGLTRAHCEPRQSKAVLTSILTCVTACSTQLSQKQHQAMTSYCSFADTVISNALPLCIPLQLFTITRGGISKATRMLHLTEDVFCGCNHIIRGGRVRYKEYISCGKVRVLLHCFCKNLSSGI